MPILDKSHCCCLAQAELLLVRVPARNNVANASNIIYTFKVPIQRADIGCINIHLYTYICSFFFFFKRYMCVYIFCSFKLCYHPPIPPLESGVCFFKIEWSL
ncbi:hypothetical protein XENTR_v10011714 [Xenopus tropicalis]|nr:hypothetical protein XENTR_v10011714 [Xenopus tropicalis]